MYKFSLILFATIFFSTLNAQNGLIKYKLNYKNATKAKYYNMLFDNSTSFYEQNIDSLPKKATSQIDLPISKESEIVYKNYKTKKLIFKERIALDFYTVNDTIIKINWEVLPDTKRIGNYLCQKATGKFRGVNYTAWFTSEIAIPFGPWKIGGLSGLILELSIEDERLHIIAYEIDIKNYSNISLKEKIQKFETLEKIELKKYIELKNSEDKQLDKYYESLFERGTYFGMESSNPLILEIFDKKEK